MGTRESVCQNRCIMQRRRCVVVLEAVVAMQDA